MKILHVVPIQDKVSGPTNSVTNLAEAQSFHVERVGIVSTLGSKKISSKSVKFFSISNDNFLKIVFGFSYKKINQQFQKPNIVVFHDIYNIRQSLFLLSIINKKIKIFITPRGAFSPIAFKRSILKKSIYYFFFIKPILGYVEAFIALNQKESKFISDYTKKKTIILPNGVNNNSKFYKRYKKNYEFKKKNNKIIIGFLGRFDVYIKGLDDLLEAFVDFQKKYNSKKIILVFIGGHSLKKPYNSEVYFNNIRNKLIFPKNFIVKGPFYGKRKWSELSKLDILIQPSRTEGMPNSILEALSMAIPCCISEETNMKDIILNSKSGWIIKRDRKNIYNFFCKVSGFKKTKMIEKGLRGKKYVDKNYNWEKISQPNYY
tara:strand:+ start:423 stop:1544 length:1122 start_codon:yes stop_codon:yes gene_type:complete